MILVLASSYSSPHTTHKQMLVDCVRGTIGAEVLNCRVRNENGCGHFANDTNTKTTKVIQKLKLKSQKFYIKEFLLIE